jgi:hypothetical protein
MTRYHLSCDSAQSTSPGALGRLLMTLKTGKNKSGPLICPHPAFSENSQRIVLLIGRSRPPHCFQVPAVGNLGVCRVSDILCSPPVGISIRPECVPLDEFTQQGRTRMSAATLT